MMVYYLGTCAQRIFTVTLCMLAYTTCVRAESYGTYHEFLQVQKILRMVNGIAHKAPRPERGKKIDFALGKRGIEGLEVYSDRRPKKGLMLNMSSGRCELFTPWGIMVLFVCKANYHQKYYDVMLEQLCSNLSIEFRTSEHCIPDYMVQKLYYTIEDGKRIAFDVEKCQQGLTIPVIAESESDVFYYMVTRVYEARIPRITAFFHTKNDESELIQAEWCAHEARYNEEQAAYKKRRRR